MTKVAAEYASVRDRVLVLLADLDDQRAASVVPACPEWTVRDLAAHMAGVPTDALAGDLDGAATDPWTARQVAERADHSLAEIVAELQATAEPFDAALAAVAEVDPRLIIDAWTHEQDLRHALGTPGGRDGPALELVAEVLTGELGAAVDAAELPAIRYFDEADRERRLGRSEPGITLRCSRFELCRARMGRRSEAQLRELGWSADPERYLRVLVKFTAAADAIDE